MAFTALQAASGTLVASTAQAVTFGDNTANIAIRYAYVAVANTGTALLYARTDGTAATIGGDLCIAVPAGVTVVIANALRWWTQAANVIGGTPSAQGAGLNTFPWDATEPQPYGTSFYGGTASPGTSVSLISSATPTFTVSGTG